MSRLFAYYGINGVNISCNYAQSEQNNIEFKADGWGIGFYRNKSSFLFKKALRSSGPEELTNLSEVVTSHVFLSHFRTATVGEIKEANTQPFRWGNWLFAHSGTVHHFRKIKSRIMRKLPVAYKKHIRGNTDSEYCFYLFLSMLRGEGGIKKGECPFPSAIESFKKYGTVLNEIFEDAEIEKEPELNMIISNGNYLLASRYGQPVYYHKFKLENEGESTFRSNETGLNYCLIDSNDSNEYYVLASEPLSDDVNWDIIPDKSVLGIDENLNVVITPWI